MIILALTIAVLVLAYLLQAAVPAVAGFLAVIPIKIIGVVSMAPDRATRLATLDGVIVGQFLWGGALLVLRWWWRS